MDSSRPAVTPDRAQALLTCSRSVGPCPMRSQGTECVTTTVLDATQQPLVRPFRGDSGLLGFYIVAKSLREFPRHSMFCGFLKGGAQGSDVGWRKLESDPGGEINCKSSLLAANCIVETNFYQANCYNVCKRQNRSFLFS